MDVDRTLEEQFVVGDDGTVQIRATVCQRCDSRWYPARTVCAACGNKPLEPLLAGPAATVYAATTMRVGASGFTAPYSLAYLDVDGLRMLAHVKRSEEQALPPRPGTRVRLRAGIIDGDAGLSAYLAFPDDEGTGGDA
jgi:uncharacterized OB-fold protein